MAVTSAKKSVSFSSPYIGSTFQKLALDILGRDGYLGGGLTGDNGSTITIQPFKIVQRGIVAETLAAVPGIAVPTAAEPWFMLAAVPDDDPDSGVIITVSANLPAATEGLVVAYKANGAWSNPFPVDIRAAASQSRSSEVGKEQGLVAFETIDGSRDVDEVFVDTGELVDADGLRRRLPRKPGGSAAVDSFTPLRPHGTSDRMDYLILRQREQFSSEIIEVTGGTGRGSSVALTFSKPAATTRIGHHSKRGGTDDEQWYCWGVGSDLKNQGGPTGGGFVEATLLTGSGTINAVWVVGQRASDDAVIVLYVDGPSLRVVSFDPITGAQIDAPVTIDTEANDIKTVRGEMDYAEQLNVVYEHDEGAVQQIYFTRIGVVLGATFGLHQITPRIVSGASSGNNDTWPDIAVDRLGVSHIVYTTSSLSNDYGNLVYAVISATGALESIATYTGAASVGFQADANDNVGFVARVYDELHRARITVTPHDEVYACVFGNPNAGLGSGSVSSALIFSPTFAERLGFPIVNISADAAAGDYVAGDIIANETGDLRALAIHLTGGSINWTETAFAIDTDFAPNGKIGSSMMFKTNWYTSVFASNFSEQSKDAFLGSAPDGDMVSSVDIGTGSQIRYTGRWPGSSTLSQRRPTPHRNDIYLAGYMVPAGGPTIPTDDGAFQLFNTRSKKMSFPFLVSDQGGEYSGFDGLHEAIRAAGVDGGTVVLRPGKYHFGSPRNWVDGQINLPSGVSIVGDGPVLLTGVNLTTGTITSQSIGAVAGNIVQRTFVSPLRPGDYIVFNTGAVHRVRAILPPSPTYPGRYLVDNDRNGAAPTGAETSFLIRSAGIRIENLTIDGYLNALGLWGAQFKGLRFRTAIDYTYIKVMDLDDCRNSVFEDIDFTECVVTAAGQYLDMDGGEGNTLRNVRLRDTDAFIGIQSDTQFPTLENILGDSTDYSKSPVVIYGGRSTPVSMMNVGPIDGSSAQTTVPGKIVAPFAGQVISFEDENTRASAPIASDLIKLTSSGQQEFNGATPDVITGAVNERVLKAGDSMSGNLSMAANILATGGPRVIGDIAGVAAVRFNVGANLLNVLGAATLQSTLSVLGHIITPLLMGADIDTNGTTRELGNPAGASTARFDVGANILNALGAATLQSTLSVAGLVISTLIPNATGLDLGSAGNRWDVFAQDIDASGQTTVANYTRTGTLKHGTMVRSVSAHTGLAGSGTWTTGIDGPTTATASNIWIIPIQMHDLDRATSWAAYAYSTNDIDTFTAQLFHVAIVGGVSVALGSAVALGSLGGGFMYGSHLLASPFPITGAGESLVIRLTRSANSGGTVTAKSVQLGYDRI